MDPGFKEKNKEKCDVTSFSQTPCLSGRRSPNYDRPNMSDLRIVLLGKSVSDNSRVGNFILGRAAFDSEAPPDVVERVRGRLKDRHVIIINSPRLLQTNILWYQMTQTVRECVNLSDPGPHVIVLLLKHEHCSTEDQECVEKVLGSFSERVYQHTMVLTTQEPNETNDILQKIIQKCANRHFSLQRSSSLCDLLQMFEDIVKVNDGQHLDCAEASQYFNIEQQATEKISESIKLNLVVCGIDVTLKSSISEWIQQQTDVKLHGHKISLLQLPALIQLSEEEVMRQILRCVSLCHPGVHVFLLIIPDAPINNEDKAEMEELQRIFSSRINKHIMVLIMQNSEHQTAELNEETRSFIESFGGRHYFFGPKTQVSTLMENIRQMLEKNRGKVFSTETFLEAQMKKLLRFEEMEKKIHSLETRLLSKGLEEREDDLRKSIKVGESSKEENKMKNLMERVDQMNREREELMKKHKEEKRRMKMIVEEERQNHDKEKKRREEEFNEREEQYKRKMKEKEDHMRDKEEWERQKQEERQKEDEECRKKEKQMSDEQIQRLKNEIEGMIKENKRIEREKHEQVEDLETRLKEERNMTEALQKSFEENLKLLEEQYEDELKIRQVEWREEYEREKEEMKKKICSETDDSLQASAYRKLETEYSKWSWRLCRAMMETENKLQNKIENEAIHEIEENDLQGELKETSEEVQRSMSELFEKDKDKDLLIQWKMTFDIKMKDVEGNIVRETKRKLNEILQQRDLIKAIDDQRTHHENTHFEKSKELVLKLKDKANDKETMSKEFDLFWEQWMKKIISDTPPIRDIDIMRDMREILSNVYKSALVDHKKERRDIFCVPNYLEYVWLKRVSGLKGMITNVYKSAVEKFGYSLSMDDANQITSLITDVVLQTDTMIQSFNISKMGYNISFIQQLIGYIKRRVTEHEEGQVNYVFKNEFFVDLVYSICMKANKKITDQHRLFREANDPVICIERKREEYYSIFQKYCQGATSAAIFGEIICQKLKEPIEQSVYKKTARDLADEIRSNCESLNGNRSKLEKHILKTLAEEEDFDKYMDYIHNPRDHFKSFIRDEVSRYITDKFNVSIWYKMKENIKLLQKKIIKAAHQSTEHVKVNSGDVSLWLKSFTQQLSDELIFSEKDLSGVKHDDVDVKLLEGVIKKVFPYITTDISREFTIKAFDEKLSVKYKPDELLIDHFCRCCWVQCPFCRATCTNTIENHDGDHSVAFHRVRGINGTCYRFTPNLCADICTHSVASDQDIYTPSERIPWSKIQIEVSKYAIWHINPGHSVLPYWKWFVCRFQKDLEKYYSKTFECEGEIPYEWRTYTKQDAIKSLDKYIQWIK
ncbi:interferon-induced very large GTPase 1-like [Carassius auratus]|uniref:Interferon-induced very large GTPase 1-like n=1 Tax=Carassius auratus TaxID=7957 RepID=A0A6P6MHX9_CARAU|nr:interferon-induced very large GTPase 1-like [Carassius auratus]